MSQAQEALTFPTDRDTAGRAEWTVLFNKAAQLPDTLDRSDRVEFSRFMNTIIRDTPCQDCKIHAYGYMKEHPPDFTTRDNVINYLCEFKNSVRRRQGKSTISCASIHVNTDNCPTCGIRQNHEVEQETQSERLEQQTSQEEPQSHKEIQEEQEQVPEQQTQEVQQTQVEPDLSEDFEAYKRIQTQMFENLCKTENIPVPPIFHAPCPEHENTSCVRKNNETGNTEVYLHPGTTDNRQRLHEFKHYLDIVKGQETSEETADGYAMDVLSKHFKLDKASEMKSSQVYADSTKEKKTGVYEDAPNYNFNTNVEPIIADVKKKAKDEWTTYADAVTGQLIPTTANDPILGITGVSPYTAQVMQEVEQRRREEEEKKKQESGLISNLDGLYRFPSGLVGLTPQELNNIHTPTLIKTALMTLVESNTTPFGSALVSFSLGIVLFIAAVFTKGRISHRDLFALSTLSAQFTWNTMEYLNPKNHMKTTLFDVIKKKARLRDMVIETPRQHAKRESWMNRPIMPIPHTAFARSFATGPSDVNTIRIRQAESRARYDAMRPGPERGGRGLTPMEERALARDYGSTAGSYYDLPPNPNADLYGGNDYPDDLYYGNNGYVPSNPALQQIQVISDSGESGY